MQTTSVPERFSLVAQVADILRQDIVRGKFGTVLPGERPLSESMQISRSTLTKSLQVLRHEGWIQIAHGRRSRIVRRPSTRISRITKKTVGVLLPEPLRLRTYPNLLTITELQHYLHKKELRLHFHSDPHCHNQALARRLNYIIRECNASCWLLCSASYAIQRWFMKEEIPCVLDGYPFEGIQLPSIDIDYEALCRHAVGLFLSQGHRRIALVSHQPTKAGEILIKNTFINAWRQSLHAGTCGRIYSHNTAIPQFERRVVLQPLARGKARLI
jgi:DNA-binding LacI/PurR family transcriptional regulator